MMAEEAVNDLSGDRDSEVTREGLFGMLAGKAKEAAGELVGNETLADDGREQQADAEAEPEATPAADEEQPGDRPDPEGDKTQA
jgi:uncharacterized protein YjbJ (UPF0337 family)